MRTCLERYEADFYEGGIELDIDGLVIDGNGRTIDGAGLSRIFHISADDVTIKNITLKNGRSFKNADNFLNNPGGAIHNENGSLSVSATEFDNNNGVSAGKTIFNDYKVHPSKVNIDDCIITDERSDDIYICLK